MIKDRIVPGSFSIKYIKKMITATLHIKMEMSLCTILDTSCGDPLVNLCAQT